MTPSMTISKMVWLCGFMSKYYAIHFHGENRAFRRRAPPATRTTCAPHRRHVRQTGGRPARSAENRGSGMRSDSGRAVRVRAGLLEEAAFPRARIVKKLPGSRLLGL